MKNFFKKLSFVLAIAMVLTTLAPATASAAAKNYAKVNGKKAASTTAFFGGVERKIVPYFNGKTSSKVTVSYSKEGIAKVENNGVVKPLKNGTTVVTFKSGKNTVKVTVKVRTRAKALNIYDRAEYKAGKKEKLTAVELKVGEKKDLQVTMPIYAKAKKAGAVKSSYYTYASTSDDAVVKVNKLGNGQRHFEVEALAAGTAKVTIVANQKTLKNVKADDYWVEASFDVTVKDEKIEAKQTGVNKITVTGTDLTDKTADYVVKRGTVTLSLKSVTLNDAKTEAVLTASSSTMPKGDYTLSFNKGDEVAFTVEEGKVTKIVVDPEVAILKEGDSTKAYTYFKVLNQFDEDVTSAEIGNIEVTGGTKDSTTNGKVVFSNGSTPYTLGLSTVALSIVCKTNGVNYVKVLNVEASPKLAETEFKGVYKLNSTTNKYEPAEVSVNAANTLNQYFLVFAAKDQYGMQAASTVTGGAIASLQVNLSSVTSLKAGAGTPWTANQLGDYTAYIAYPLTKDASATLRAGEVNVLAVQLTDGKTVTGKFTVSERQLIDTLTITASGYVYGGEYNELEFTALDQDGKEIKAYDSLKNFTFTDTRLSFAPKADGTAKLFYNAAPNTNTIDTPTVLTWLSESNKFGQVSISVKPNRVLKAVIGVVDGKTLAMTTGTTTLSAVDFKYQDQYGNVVTVDDDLALVVANSTNKNIVITCTSDNTAFTTSNLAKNATASAIATSTTQLVNVVRNAASAGSISYKVAIDGVAASDFTFSISNVGVGSVSNFEIGDINRVQVTSTTGGVASFKVYGYANGTKVELVNGTDYTIHGTTNQAPTIADAEGYKVKEQEVIVIIKNAAGTTLTKKFEYGNAPAAPVTVVANPKYYGSIAATTTAAVTAAEFNASGYAPSNIVLVTDQYGGHGAFSPRITLSGFSAADATVDRNGTTTAQIQWKTTGHKTVNVKYVYDNGVTFETTVVVDVQ